MKTTALSPFSKVRPLTHLFSARLDFCGRGFRPCGFRGASGVGSIVRHRLQRAGVEAPTYGTHQFRHGLATQLLRHGASLGEIGELLGHHSPETTKIYTKVDLDALRTLALPWPGGAR
jgi:integrase/recombinase XerD